MMLTARQSRPARAACAGVQPLICDLLPWLADSSSSDRCVMSGYAFELLGILIALGLLIFLAFRGYTLLLAAPAAAIVAAAFSGEPLLAKWTLTFMQGTGRFIVNFFPLFLLGGVFGKLMDDSGAALSIARTITERLGETRAVMAVVLACAALTYGGVSLFVVAFAVFPVADALFRQAAVPHRLIPPAIALGAFTFTMTALPGTPAIQNAIPMAYFGTTLFAAPVLGILASATILGFGLWWLRVIEARARRAGEGYSAETQLQLPMNSSCASAPRTPTTSTLPNCRTAIEASSCRPLRWQWRQSLSCSRSTSS